MPGTDNFWAFLLACCLSWVTPRPNTMYILARRSSGPPGSGIAYGLGVALAAAVAVVAIAVGIAGEPPPGPKPPAKDAPPVAATPDQSDGGPLPAGALARVGSSRFRLDGWHLTDLRFSANSKYIAAAASQHRLAVWEVATGREVLKLTAERTYLGCRFSSDGKCLVTGYWVASDRSGGRQEIRCYDVATGREVSRIDGFPFRQLDEWRIDPRDKVCIYSRIAPGVRELRGFEIPSGKEIAKTVLPSRTDLIDWAPGGDKLLLSRGQTAMLHDAGSLKPLWDEGVEYRRESISRLSADGKRFVTVTGGRAQVRDAATGKAAGEIELPAFKRWGYGEPELSPSGRYCVVRPDQASRDAHFVVLDLDRKRVCLHWKGYRVDRWDVSPDGRFLAACDGNFHVRVWDLTRQPADPVATLSGAYTVRFSPDGAVLAGDAHGCVVLWETKTWKGLPQSAWPASSVEAVRFTRDGKGVVGLTADGWRVWDDWSKAESRLIFGRAEGHRSDRSAISAAGDVVVEVLEPGAIGPGTPATAEVRAFDLRTGRQWAKPGPEWAARDPVVSADGRRAVTIDPDDGKVIGWEIATGAALRLPPGAGTPWDAFLALSGDGRWLAVLPHPSGSEDRAPALRVWDLDAGREAASFPGLVGAPTFHGPVVRFSPDGRRLVALAVNTGGGGPKGPVKAWDWARGRELLLDPAAVSGLPTAIGIAPDGRSCALGTVSGPISVVELASGKQRAEFRHAGPIYSAEFHPDGTKLVAASPEAPVHVWDLLGDPGKWEAGQADRVWADLASADAKVAFAAIRRLRVNPSDAVAFLRDRVKVPAVPADEAITALVTRLDAAAFADRERAQKELTAVADCVRPKLEAARKAEKSEEVARRLDQVLKTIDEMTPERIRQVRACEVLEGIRTADAVGLLRSWATGPSGARLTIEARESLDRLKP